MAGLIDFQNHEVESPIGQAVFSPPYLLERDKFKAIIGCLNQCGLSVLECLRDDRAMTLTEEGINDVVKAMREKISEVNPGVLTIDVGMSLGAGLLLLARDGLQGQLDGRLIISPVPDPVTPWDDGVFLEALKASAEEAPHLSNYQPLVQVREAMSALTSEIATSVITEKRDFINSQDQISDWGKQCLIHLKRVNFPHGVFSGKGELTQVMEQELQTLLPVPKLALIDD